MLVVPSPPLHPTLPTLAAQVHIDRREASDFKSSIVPVVLLSILAICILGPFIGRIAYLYYTGRDWAGCLQPASRGAGPRLTANQAVIAREMTIHTETFAPGFYASAPLASPASHTAPPYSPYPATPIDCPPAEVRTLTVPSLRTSASVPELPKAGDRDRASGRSSRLGRLPSLRGMSWGGGRERDGGPVQVHVRVSTVYDRPPDHIDDGDASGESVEESSEGCGRCERGARSPPPAYPGSADGHV